MARIRTIKPEFFTSEDIVSLSPLARLLYIAIWCESDKEGRLVWKPATLKLRYMPGDNIDINSLCTEILDRDLVKLYGEGLAFVPSFSAHQHINPRESASQLPEPQTKLRVGTRQPRVGTGANLDVHPQVGREGKGKEGLDNASAFAQFYEAYPNKSGKKTAQTAFEKARIEDLSVLLSDIAIRSQSREWLKNEGEFIPMPSTYLNQRRWEDGAMGQKSGGVLPGAI